MREVIKPIPVKEEPPPTILSSSVSTKKYYGVDHGDGIKSFILRPDYENMNFHSLYVLSEFTAGNSRDSFDKKDLNFPSYIEYLISGGCRVYEFDKLSELALWLEN